jgi:hypothetical protein
MTTSLSDQIGRKYHCLQVIYAAIWSFYAMPAKKIFPEFGKFQSKSCQYIDFQLFRCFGTMFAYSAVRENLVCCLRNITPVEERKGKPAPWKIQPI